VNPCKSLIINYIYIYTSTTCITIPTEQEDKYFGLILDTRLTWAAHIKGLGAKL
jgi:hypothetical protein